MKAQKVKEQPLPYRKPSANGTTVPSVPARFETQLDEFLTDLARLERSAPPTNTDVAKAEWERVRDVARPILEHVAAKLRAAGKQSSVEVNSEGALLWRLRLRSAPATMAVSYRVCAGQTHIVVSQDGKPGERTCLASAATPSWICDSCLRHLITIAYGG